MKSVKEFWVPFYRVKVIRPYGRIFRKVQCATSAQPLSNCMFYFSIWCKRRMFWSSLCTQTLALKGSQPEMNPPGDRLEYAQEQ
ncbi:MAG: hypothetical protein ABIH23_13490, partial [bacterium]